MMETSTVLRTNRRFNGFRRNHAVRIDRQNGHLKALALQCLRAVQNGMMLDCGDNQVTPLLLIRLHRTLERPVVALRAAAGKENLRALCADDRSNLRAGVLHRFVALIGKAVRSRRIGVLLHHKRTHCFKSLAAEPRCRGIIHINHK